MDRDSFNREPNDWRRSQASGESSRFSESSRFDYDYTDDNYRVIPDAVPADTAYLGIPADAAAPRRNWASTLGRIFMWAVLATAVLLILGLIATVGVYFYYAGSLPPAEQLAAVPLNQSTKIYDRNGGLLYEVLDPNSGRRTVIPPEKIPQVLKQATLATEDPTFYSNPGVDFYGVARAIYYLVRYHRAVVGGSTITQQLVKNTLLSADPTVERKIREAILATEITRRYSKDQILAFYLNTIFYGNLSYGIQAASQSYFNKDVSNLNLAEASLLAGLPQAPAIYDPCVNPDAALDRQQIVLSLMQKQRYINATQAEAATSEMEQRLHSPDFANNCKAGLGNNIAPHFVDYVRSQLEQEYGTEYVFQGLQVYTSLDPAIQKIVEDEARKQIAKLKPQNVNSAAAVVINPQNGEILAMLGSVDYNDKKIDGQVNVAVRDRQPGSSIKPINYVTALQKGWTPATPILDIRTEFPNGNQPPYVPINYDKKDHGIVDVRHALGNSLNIPAVKTLYFVTVPSMIATAQKMGITSFKDPNRYGLALTLGGGEVKLVELTGAYGVFANQGKLAPTKFYTKIIGGDGKPVPELDTNKPEAGQVIDPRHAYLITSILSDNNARVMEFGANSPLKTSRPTFVKTGTTNDFRDNWTLGGTTELVVGVWAGNPRNQPMNNVSGVTGAAPIWHNVIERVYKEVDPYKGIAPHDFPIPQGLVRAEVCNESGLLPTDLCPRDHRHSEIFVQEQAPKQPDNVWVKVKIDKTNNLLANDNCPPEIVEERVFEKMPQDVVMPYDKVVAWANANHIPQPPTQMSPCTNAATPEPTTEVTPTPEVQQPSPTPPEAGLPLDVHIVRPGDNDAVSGTVRVIGTASVPNFANYVVEVGRGDQWVPIGGGGNPVYPRGQLASFDSRPLPDGPYMIRLTVVDQGGGSTQDEIRITVSNAVPPTQPPPPTAPPQPTPTKVPPTQVPPTQPPPPTEVPTQAPTVAPTEAPTQAPAASPTPKPTKKPKATPTTAPGGETTPAAGSDSSTADSPPPDATPTPVSDATPGA